jgi:hypothetical protein
MENFSEGIAMVPVISANALLVWFVWGLFMAMGWVLGRWIMEWLIGLVSRHRNRARDFVALRRNT